MSQGSWGREDNIAATVRDTEKIYSPTIKRYEKQDGKQD